MKIVAEFSLQTLMWSMGIFLYLFPFFHTAISQSKLQKEMKTAGARQYCKLSMSKLELAVSKEYMSCAVCSSQIAHICRM